jgi:hypothetical protein
VFTPEQVKVIQQIVDDRLGQLGLARRIGQVAEVSGNDTDGYYARLYLDGSTSVMSAPVRCLRHYTPVVGERVSVLCRGSTLLEVAGKIN